MTDRPIVILGAGPAGMGTAWQLSKDSRKVVVLEKSNHVGGLGGTVEVNGFRLDYGPHIFCMRGTPESDQLVKDLTPLFGEDAHVFSRRDRILLHKKFFSYPFRIPELLAGVPISLAARILWDYLKANATLKVHSPRKGMSFEEWGVKNLGRTLYDLCFGIYTQRVWGLPTSQISSRQAQRVVRLNLTEIILRLLGFKIDPAAHFKKFMYPRGGIGRLYERMAEELKHDGGEIRLNSPVIRIIRTGSRIERVMVRMSDGRDEEISCQGVISTIPLPVLVDLFDPPLSEGMRQAASRLLYRSVQFCYVVISKERVTDLHWCYLLDPEYRCNRVSEQKNVSAEMLPKDKTVLLWELTCSKGDPIWNASEEELRAVVEADIQRSGLLKDGPGIEDFFARRVEHAYPVYKLNFEEDLFPVLEGLHRLDNFVSVGRHGLFLNNSMDDNILLGHKVREFLSRQGNGAWNPFRWFEEMLDFMQLKYEGQ